MMARAIAGIVLVYLLLSATSFAFGQARSKSPARPGRLAGPTSCSSWPTTGRRHTPARCGDPVVKTPTFDRVRARGGVVSECVRVGAVVHAKSPGRRDRPVALAIKGRRQPGRLARRRRARVSGAPSIGRLLDRLCPQGRGAERPQIHPPRSVRAQVQDIRGIHRPAQGRRAVLLLVRRRRTASPVPVWRRRGGRTEPRQGQAARLPAGQRNHAPRLRGLSPPHRAV